MSGHMTDNIDANLDDITDDPNGLEPFGVSPSSSSSSVNQGVLIRRFSRSPTTLGPLSNSLKLDIRAHQRTYEGAYTRTALGCLAFSIMIIKLFSDEFLPIGTIYTLYGFIVFCFGLYKSRNVSFIYNPVVDKEYFRTSGNSVMILSGISLVCYLGLLVLILRM